MFVSFGSSCLLYHLPVPYIILTAIRLSMSFEIFLSVTSAYAKMVDAKKDAAADAIQITLTDDMIGTPIDPKKE